MPVSLMRQPLLFQPPAGLPPLELTAFRGEEGLSRLFHFTLELRSPDELLDLDALADALLGKGVTFGVRQAGQDRAFHGIVSRLTVDEGGAEAEVVPWLWLLSRSADCRAFAGKTIKEILEAVFSPYPFADFQLDLRASYPKWEACLQYRETTLNFVLRLLEQEGISFHFRHQPGKHTLVITDAPAAGAPLAVPFRRDGAARGAGHNAVHSWQRRREVGTGRYTLTAWDWKAQKALTLSEKAAGPGVGETYDLGEYDREADGRRLRQVRMEEEEGPAQMIHGGGNVLAFAPGEKFRFEPPRGPVPLAPAELGGEYLLTSVEHHTQEGGDGRATVYGNTFTCLPKGVAFRPPRRTPKPLLAGVQPALVVGRDGQPRPGGGAELHADEHGRVLLRFFWERGKPGPDCSVWARVAQPWAGNGFGTQFWPRIGQEVMVAFEEGDPDHPVVLGCVYSGGRALPFDPREQPAVSGVRSHSSPDRARSHGNEVSFDDSAGKERLHVGAQRDLEVVVGHDERRFVQGEQVERVGKDRRAQVGGDRVEQVDGDQGLKVGGKLQEQVGGAFGLSAGGDVHIKAGAKLVLEAGAQLSLVVGGNYVDVGPAGVTVNGALVRLNCSGGSPAKGAGVSVPAPQVPHPPARKGR
jgi:type VI secretion system secreted protein VgrG